MSDVQAPAVGQIVTWDEAIATVQGLITFLKHANPGCELGYLVDGKEIIAVPDAYRAGHVLQLVMETMGHA